MLYFRLASHIPTVLVSVAVVTDFLHLISETIIAVGFAKFDFLLVALLASLCFCVIQNSCCNMIQDPFSVILFSLTSMLDFFQSANFRREQLSAWVSCLAVACLTCVLLFIDKTTAYIWFFDLFPTDNRLRTVLLDLLRLNITLLQCAQLLLRFRFSCWWCCLRGG